MPIINKARFSCFEDCILQGKHSTIGCMAFCNRIYHQSCITKNTGETDFKDWMCPDCLNSSSQSINSQDLMNIDTQELFPTNETQAQSTPVDLSVTSPIPLNDLTNYDNPTPSTSGGTIPHPTENNIDNSELGEPRLETTLNENPLTEYRVKKLVGHRKKKDEMHFWVNWDGYSSDEDTLEPESGLGNVYDMVKEYRTKHKLGPIQVVRMVGATKKRSGHNPSKWVTMNRILETIPGYLQPKFKNKIPVEILEDKTDNKTQDTVYLIPIDHHCIVGLSLAKMAKMFIADGENACTDDETVLSTIGSRPR